MIPVAANYFEYLMGFDGEVDYLVPQDDTVVISQKIVNWWMNRWAIRRAAQDNVLTDVESHDFTYPIQHGARVKTPIPIDYQAPMFDLSK